MTDTTTTPAPPPKLDYDLYIESAKGIICDCTKILYRLGTKWGGTTGEVRNTFSPKYNYHFTLSARRGQTINLELEDIDNSSRTVDNASFRIPDLFNEEEYFECLQFEKKGQLNISIKCKSTIITTPKYKRIKSKRDQVLKFKVSKLTGMFDRQQKVNIGTITYRLKIVRKGKPEIIMDPFNAIENKDLQDCVFYIQCVPGEFIKFAIEKEGTCGESLTTMHEGIFLIGDFQKNEQITEHIPLSYGAIVHFDVTCLRSVYRLVDPNVMRGYQNTTKYNLYDAWVYVERADNLIRDQYNGRNDIYVKYKGEHDQTEKRTRIIYDAVFPRWNCVFRSRVHDNQDIEFTIFDVDGYCQEKPIGSTIARICDLRDNTWKGQEYYLNTQGTLQISFKKAKIVSQMYTDMRNKKYPLPNQMPQQQMNQQMPQGQMNQQVPQQMPQQANQQMNQQNQQGVFPQNQGIPTTSQYCPQQVPQQVAQNQQQGMNQQNQQMPPQQVPIQQMPPRQYSPQLLPQKLPTLPMPQMQQNQQAPQQNGMYQQGSNQPAGQPNQF